MQNNLVFHSSNFESTISNNQSLDGWSPDNWNSTSVTVDQVASQYRLVAIGSSTQARVQRTFLTTPNLEHHFQYDLSLLAGGNAVVSVQQMIGSSYQTLPTTQTQTASGSYIFSFVPTSGNIRIIVTGSNRFALTNLHLERDHVDVQIESYLLYAAGYRYGFQNQERDDEVKGAGNSVNYTYRMHDPRIGRFFAVDPLTKSYPMLTPYQFSSNNTTWYVELEGLEGTVYQYKEWYEPDGMGNPTRRTEYLGSYHSDDLDGDINKYHRKEYNNPNSETIIIGYAAKDSYDGKPYNRFNWKVDDSERPDAAKLNDLLGLTRKKNEEIEQAKRQFDYDRKKDAPLPARLFVKIVPGISMVDAAHTIFTGEEMMQPGVKVEGVFNRYISPSITMLTGGLFTLPKVISTIGHANTVYGAVTHTADSLIEE